METNPSENEKNIAALTHLSTFSKFLFPFGNFVAPLLLWTINKDKPFVNEHGRQAVNFQLSILIYTLLIGIICLPFFVIFAPDFVSLVDAIDDHWHRVTVNNITNLSGYAVLFLIVALLLLGLFVFELYAVINATVHANKGELYKYPLSIPFIKTTIENQSSNEHIS
ncbi:DUF4870 domain-containing protein [Aureitalea marina]|uniref:DUF4870 domain-containing protein n=1 Tax=Aureitalea marina TaxID=930804 RepID=A0A2S7KPV4_9FLAO|nr:DUF4870 domain-containing protein [Aureitalea marina]PQB04659.1 hypothetical protein BST85_06935 [Aureitalea marina]